MVLAVLLSVRPYGLFPSSPGRLLGSKVLGQRYLSPLLRRGGEIAVLRGRGKTLLRICGEIAVLLGRGRTVLPPHRGCELRVPPVNLDRSTRSARLILNEAFDFRPRRGGPQLGLPPSLGCRRAALGANVLRAN